MDTGKKSGSSNLPQSFTKLRVRRASGNHFDLYPEKNGGSETSGIPESHPDVTDVSVSSKHSNSQPDEHVYEGELHFPHVKFGSSSSSSSTFSSFNASVSDDISLVNTKKGVKTGSAAAPSYKRTQGNVQPKSQVRKDVVSRNSSGSNISLKSEVQEAVSPDPGSVCRISDVTHDSSIFNMSPTRLPQVQLMKRSDGYDPHRISSSIFARSSSVTPLEWSAASNESLFSLHLEHNSFSKDHIILRNLYKSGEITKSGELFSFSPHPPIASFDTHSPFPFPEIGRPSIETGTSAAIRVKDEAIEDTPKTAAKAEGEGMESATSVAWKSPKVSKKSEGSEDNTFSFVFQVKRKKCACLSCYCCSCSLGLCCCVRPKCYFRRPNCHCSRPSCLSRSPSCCCDKPSCCCIRPSCPCSRQSCCCSKPNCCCSKPNCCCCCSWLNRCCCCSRPRCWWPFSCFKWPSSCCGKCTWPSCSCGKCAWLSCCCGKYARPSCCSRECARPSCCRSKCTWSFCCLKNCSPKRWWCCRCCSSSASEDGLLPKNNGSEKSSSIRCLHCFSCCSSYCPSCRCCCRCPHCC